jgi:hypothetical protein
VLAGKSLTALPNGGTSCPWRNIEITVTPQQALDNLQSTLSQSPTTSNFTMIVQGVNSSILAAPACSMTSHRYRPCTNSTFYSSMRKGTISSVIHARLPLNPIFPFFFLPYIHAPAPSQASAPSVGSRRPSHTGAPDPPHQPLLTRQRNLFNRRGASFNYGNKDDTCAGRRLTLHEERDRARLLALEALQCKRNLAAGLVAVPVSTDLGGMPAASVPMEDAGTRSCRRRRGSPRRSARSRPSRSNSRSATPACAS